MCKAPRATPSARNRQISNVLVQMGDVAQAEAYLRRNLALIQEARTSGLPGLARKLPEIGTELGSRSGIQSRPDL